jgi:hypothetical protein
MSNGTNILTIQTGSSLYGTSVDTASDTDYMSIVVMPKDDVLGLSPFESRESRTAGQGQRSGAGDIDHTYYSLRKFLGLAAKGNPSIVTPLYAPSDFVTETTIPGRLLMFTRKQFLSKQTGFRFLGYMRGQRQRMIDSTAGIRAPRVNRPELIEEYGYDTKYAAHMIRLGLSGIELMRDQWMTLPLRDEDRQRVLHVRNGHALYADVLALAEDIAYELEVAVKASDLPDRTDSANIGRLSVQLHESAWQIAD